jgi:hypothetical protein
MQSFGMLKRVVPLGFKGLMVQYMNSPWSVVYLIPAERFGNWICFCHRVQRGRGLYSDPVETVGQNRWALNEVHTLWCIPNKYSPDNGQCPK